MGRRTSHALTVPEAYGGDKPVAPNKGVPHLKAFEVADILRWHAQGLTQEQIGERLTPPRPQKTISDCLARFGTDYTAEAKRILRGGAAHMALNIVKRGQPKDQVQALKGLGVLEEQQAQGLTVIVGGESVVNIGVLTCTPGIQLSPAPLTVNSERSQKA